MASVSSSALQIAPDFSSLYREYFGFAWASLRRLGVSTATIDDAAQDLWVTVHRRLESLDPAASVKAWLFGIARRVASHYRRTERRHQRKLAAYSVTDVRRSTEPMKRGEAALTMERFLETLDETKRVAFVLSEVEGWSAPEIARVVGTSPNTVYSRVRLARQQLRKHLGDAESNLSADACVDAVRRSTQAPPDAAKRCWVALAPKLAGAGTAAATATGGALAKLKLVGLGALLGGFGVVGLDTALPDPEPAPAPAPAVVATATTPEVEREGPIAPATPAAAPVASAPAAPSIEAPPKKPARAIAPKPSAAPADDMDLLARETKLLTEAKRQLAAGDPIAALATIRKHAKAHPDSKLSDVRNVLEVEATCARGQREQAQALAEHYAATASEAAARKLRAACR
jgi:RNA polymerase sigma-70 factor (ECF subfamily)